MCSKPGGRSTKIFIMYQDPERSRWCSESIQTAKQWLKMCNLSTLTILVMTPYGPNFFHILVLRIGIFHFPRTIQSYSVVRAKSH